MRQESRNHARVVSHRRRGEHVHFPKTRRYARGRSAGTFACRAETGTTGTSGALEFPPPEMFPAGTLVARAPGEPTRVPARWRLAIPYLQLACPVGRTPTRVAARQTESLRHRSQSEQALTGGAQDHFGALSAFIGVRRRPNQKSAARMRWLLPALAAAALLTGCGGGETRTKAVAPAPAVAVQTATVSNREWPDAYEATGTVRARTATVLSSKVMAYVREVAVQVGDHVREGQEIVKLDAQDLDANVRRAEAAEAEVHSAFPEADNGVAAAKANLDLARSTFQRMDELNTRKSISSHEFDEASARLKAAQAGYEMARAKRSQLDSKLAQVRQETRAANIIRDYTRLAAPFAGVVTMKSAEPGNLAAPGAPLLTIEREGAYRLEASVDESKMALVKAGESVEVALEGPDRRLTARVSEIVPSVDAASRAYIVKIDLPALENVRSGMFGRAWFPMGARKVMTVPAQALVERGQLQSVFVVEDGSARNRLVTTGKREADGVEVLSGLTEGEKVVSPVAPGISDGARVEVRQ